MLSKKSKSACFKWKYGNTVKDYRVSKLSKSYLIIIGIIMQNFNDGWTQDQPIQRKASLFKNIKIYTNTFLLLISDLILN